MRPHDTYYSFKTYFSQVNNKNNFFKVGQSPKSAVFGSSLSLPPHAGEGGGLVCESVDKADRLLDHFDSKHSKKAIDLLLTYHPSPGLTTFAFRSSEVRRLLFDLDPYGGTHPSRKEEILTSER